MGTEPDDVVVPLTEEGLREAAGEDDLTYVESIEIAFNGFTHLTPDALQSCRGLTHLGFVHNALRVVPPLRAVARTLTKLELSHQLLSHMRGLGEMPMLRELILNNNAIARIEGLEGCCRLERLWLFSNRIERVENLSSQGDLRELWLQDNGVVSLVGAGLEGLLNLTQLSLAGNPIEHQRELETLAFLPSLVDLSFADRFFWPAPVADSEGYRQLVITHLKQVLVLDGFDILPEERREVEDDHLRAVLDFNQSMEDLRRRHRAHANELEALREKNLAAARGVRGRLAVKLRQLEQLAGGGARGGAALYFTFFLVSPPTPPTSHTLSSPVRRNPLLSPHHIHTVRRYKTLHFTYANTARLLDQHPTTFSNLRLVW